MVKNRDDDPEDRCLRHYQDEAKGARGRKGAEAMAERDWTRSRPLLRAYELPKASIGNL